MLSCCIDTVSESVLNVSGLYVENVRGGKIAFVLSNYFLYVAAELICLLTNLVLRSRAGMPFT